MLESHGRPLFDGQKTRKTATYALEQGRYSALIGNDEGPISGGFVVEGGGVNIFFQMSIFDDDSLQHCVFFWMIWFQRFFGKVTGIWDRTGGMSLVELFQMHGEYLLLTVLA